MAEKDDIPVVFTPENEPYLGRTSLLKFDQLIPFSLWVSGHIAAYTQSNRDSLTDIQNASAQIIPQGLNLALSIRELIRQGYLFAALILMRPLIERAAMISYIEAHPDAIEKWKNGWRFRDRPSLAKMLHSLAGGTVDIQIAKDICEHYGHIIHGDPIGADLNRVKLDDGTLGYAVGKVLSSPEVCDELSIQAHSYLTILTGRAMSCFPQVKPPPSGTVH